MDGNFATDHAIQESPLQIRKEFCNCIVMCAGENDDTTGKIQYSDKKVFDITYVYMFSTKAILGYFSFKDREAWKSSVRGRSGKIPFSAHLAVSYAEKVLTPRECLGIFFKGSASVQTITADEDCPQCALLFSNIASSENVMLQYWPVSQSVALGWPLLL